MNNILGLNPKFRFIDLFAGIGGFRTALERLGGVCVFSSEIDPATSKAYEIIYGEKPAGDIRKVNAESIPDFDVLCGGFPCQAFSVAGKRLGFRDETRGTLFFEIARIAEVKKPKVLFLENVKGLVNHDDGKTLDTIVRVLSDLGYSVDFEVLNSKYFGVPQNRERIFIIGVRDFYTEPYIIPKRNTVCTKAKKRINGYGDIRTFNFNWPDNDKVTTRIRDILETSVDEKYYLSEEKTAKLVQSLNEEKDSDIKNIGYIERKNQGNRVYSIDGVSPTITSVGGGIGGHGSGVYAVPFEGHANVGQVSSEQAVNAHTSMDEADYTSDEQAEYTHGEDVDNIVLQEIINFVLRYGIKEIAVSAENVAPFDRLVQYGFFKQLNGTYSIDEDGLEIEESGMRIVGLLDMKGTDQVRRVYHPDGISPTLTTSGGGHREPKIAIEQCDGDPAIEQFSQGNGIACCLDARYYSGISSNSAGKGRRTHIIEEVRAVLTPDRLNKRQNGRRFKDSEEPAFTLTSQDVHGVAIRYSEASIINTRNMGAPSVHNDVSPTLCATDYKEPKLVHRGWRIRKLTPLECFRLQGFPDEYVHTLRVHGMSDTQLYKMAGNAVTVNVIEAIGAKLLTFDGKNTKVIETSSTPHHKSTSPARDKQEKFAATFAEYAKAKGLHGRFTSSELYNDMKKYVEENSKEVVGLNSAINLGTLLSQTVDKLQELGVDVKKNSKNWTVACKVEGTIKESASEVQESLVPFVQLMDKFLDDCKPATYKTSSLYNEVKGFADKHGMICKALSNAIFFGTCLSKEWEKVQGGRYKIVKSGKKWKIVHGGRHEEYAISD